MKHIRALTLLAAVAGMLVVVAPSSAAVPKLTGTVGPGFTITLKRSGKPFKTLKAGTYSITVSDKSNIHNFHLRGPKVNKEITQIGFKGVKTVVVKLSKGKYKYYCRPHESGMFGFVQVT
jgi:plastocyanin